MGFFLALKNQMVNRFRSHPNHENCLLYEGPRFRASLESRRDGSFFEFCSPIRRGGVPSGAAAVIVPDEKIGTIPAFYQKK